jgi:hypothetical protein
MGSTSLTNEIYLNGQAVEFATDFSWDDYPKHLYQIIEPISTVHDHRIKVTNYLKGKGSFTVIPPEGTVSSNPMTLMDLTGLRQKYTTYNTTSEVLEHNSTIYDWDPSDDGSLNQPKVPHEIRQTEATGEVAIDSDGSNLYVAQKFRAHCTNLTTLKLPLRDVAGSDVTSLDVEIWSDDSGPDELLTSAEINETGMTITNGTGYGDATWVTIDITGINDTTVLIPGTDYWIVLEGSDTDVLYVNKTINNRYSPGGLMVSDDGASWSDETGDLTFILQGTDSYGGHNLIIYDYTQSKTNYIKYTCYGCFVTANTINVASNEAQGIQINFESEQIVRTKG